MYYFCSTIQSKVVMNYTIEIKDKSKILSFYVACGIMSFERKRKTYRFCDSKNIGQSKIAYRKN